MLRHCFLFIGLIALWITSCSRTPEYTDSAARLAERIVPSHSDDFIFTLVPAEKDFFELRQNGDKIEIQGNNGISMARGLNHYLRHYCHASVSWWLPYPIHCPQSVNRFISKPLNPCGII